MAFKHTLGGVSHRFDDLRCLLAKASPLRSGDELAGVAAQSQSERVAAQYALADLPLARLVRESLLAPEDDSVSELIAQTHDAGAFSVVSHLTVGGFRDWLLSDQADSAALKSLAPGLTPEVVSAVSKLMRNQDLIVAARKCEVVTAFRNTLGLRGRIAVRLQPNHPTDDPRGIAAAVLDGLLHGCGDAVIGFNPVTDQEPRIADLLRLLDDIRLRLSIPTQTCVLTHVTQSLRLIETGAPVDLVFQSIGGTQGTNEGFGVSLDVLRQAQEAALSLKRGTVGQQVMYFETGQGSALSANAAHGVDQQTCEVRAYAVARCFDPLLVNSVVGFIGPEYLANAKQITRAGLEDHFCGKLMGLPMGMDVCYTNHCDADQDDADGLLSLLALAGCNYVMGVPGADDVMLGYQSTSFHDALYLRRTLGLRPAPEFEAWLHSMGLGDTAGAGSYERRPLAFAFESLLNRLPAIDQGAAV